MYSLTSYLSVSSVTRYVTFFPRSISGIQQKCPELLLGLNSCPFLLCSLSWTALLNSMQTPSSVKKTFTFYQVTTFSANQLQGVRASFCFQMLLPKGVKTFHCDF